MQSFSYFAIFLFVSVVAVVFGADHASTPAMASPATTVVANETSTSNTTSTGSMGSISNDDPNAVAETEPPTRKPEMNDGTKKPMLVHAQSTVTTTTTTLKPMVTVPVATSTMPTSKGNTSPMSDKKGGSGVSKVSAGLALCSLAALFTIGIFS